MNTNLQTIIKQPSPAARIYKLKQNDILENAKKNRRIGIALLDGIEIIKVSDILHCQSDGNYCKIHIRDGRIIVASRTLKNVETAISSNDFLRVHNSHLVNLSDVQKVMVDGIVLSCGVLLPVSRSRRSVLLDRISKMVAMV